MSYPFKTILRLLLVLGLAASISAPAAAQLTRELKFLSNVKKGEHHEVEVMLLSGINYNTRDIDGKPALIIAIENGDGEMVSLLLDAGADPDIVDRKSGEVPLTLAAARNNADLVGRLLAKGANPNVPNKQYETALIKAVSNDNRRMVSMLMEHGADPDWQDFTGHSAIWYAEASRRPGLLKLLKPAAPGQ